MVHFYGFLLLSGYNILPREDYYWKSDSDLQNQLVSSFLSKNKYHLKVSFAFSK